MRLNSGSDNDEMIVVVTPHFIFNKSIEKYDTGKLTLIGFSRHNDQSIYIKIEKYAINNEL
ncbi:hypothetical protein [Staphylococcus hominis]|uniref:hypothetical protein n=1 Tax=Staphylococcus hominis TaxID=1290 RepID=UPI000D40A8CE|nr:hypothetical protein [Staphylococcus hominis]PTK23370.1 hypothetical protein BUZ52_00280 [Staphylococcus hominis]